ncbi:hypothetical protein H5996_05315 [Faecalicoccus pleomorphus]|uniref:hypothetical protein n=1 Tax=Faecalicoccus pleomorphus TaxID=1323 RepID=UPI00195FFEDD|nr:hypothetical protein [Faecalicoccus pleomorphus]MBM6765326.1 hypothetical protein [Faecalicoccus pleomorphus]
MNRKKITKAALSGLVAVTMVPAMAAPLVANAEGNDTTAEQSAQKVNVVIEFTIKGTGEVINVNADDLTVGAIVDLNQYVPEGYKLAQSSTTFVPVSNSDIIPAEIEEVSQTVIQKIVFMYNGQSVGGGDYFVTKGNNNYSVLEQYVPEGYKMTTSGDFYADGTNTIFVNVEKIYNASIIKLVFVDENGENVGGGDYFVDEDGDGIFNWSEVTAPAGYRFSETGDDFVEKYSATEAKEVRVEKINKGTIINVVFEDPQGNNLGGGDFLVDLDGDGVANYSELGLPMGYKLNVTGDFFVEEGGHYTVVLNREDAAIIHVVFKSEGGKNLGGGDYFVDEDGDGIFNYSELTLPEGYELIVTGDEFVDTEKTYEIVLNKEIEGTIINVVYVDEEGNNLGGGDFFVDPDDDGIANYSELDLPEGYELIVTGDFFVTPGKSYTITLHKITEEETAAATLVVRYVDQENGNEVVLEKTYDDQVGPVGETATYIEDVVVPEGYELVQDIEGIAADVEYGQTKVMYVFVTKTAQEPTQPGDEEEPNTPAEGTEESEQTDGTDTGVAMSLAGVFGTMSAALAGMVALLRRKQK